MSGTTVDATALGDELIAAVRAALAKRRPALQSAVEAELRRLAGALADVCAQSARGELDPERAKLLVGLHRTTLQGVFRSIEGLSLLATNDAMAAAVRVAGGVVNRAVGFKLL